MLREAKLPFAYIQLSCLLGLTVGMLLKQSLFFDQTIFLSVTASASYQRYNTLHFTHADGPLMCRQSYWGNLWKNDAHTINVQTSEIPPVAHGTKGSGAAVVQYGSGW